MTSKATQLYEFADFRVDSSQKVLLRNGKTVPLTPKVFDTLEILVENTGKLLEKDDLMQRLWQDRFVEESNLTSNIKMLRKALGDDAAKPKFIETIPRRGYRFIADVDALDSDQRNGANGQAVRAETDSSRARKIAVSILAAAVVLIASIAVGSWYLENSGRAEAPILSAPFSSEKLSTDGNVRSAVISPDGTNVIYAKGTIGRQSVWLRQLESSNNVLIIPPSDDIYYELAFSPDGNFLYFVRRPKGFEGQGDIYRVSIFGGIPTKIVSETQGSISVSADGEKISFRRCYYREDEYCSLWIADALDGKNERKLASRPRPIRIGDNQISPDGRSVAFAIGQSQNQANEFGLVEIDVESGTERELTAQKFFNIKHLAWLPDGSGLLSTASQIPTKHFRIWQVSAATGEALPLTKDSESYSALSLNKEASVLVSTQTKQDFRLRLLNMENLSAGRVLADASSVAFAPDGKIVFSSPMSGNDEIWSVNADGSGQRQLTNNAADELTPIVSPDGNSIFFASNRTGAAHVWRMNADGSSQEQITKTEGGYPIFVSPDGRWLYYHHGLNRTLWRVSTNGDLEQLAFNKRNNHFAVSPDGLQTAFSEKQGEEIILKIISLADGQAVKTFKFVDGSLRLIDLEWSRDGENLAYILADGEYGNKTLWFQPLNGKTPRQIADLGNERIAENFGGLALSPDGKSFAVVQGGWKHDAVLLKGLR